MKVFIVSVMTICVLTACTRTELKQHNQTQKMLNAECRVNPDIQRNTIPQTPNNISLPAFGQGIIGWETGEEGAKQRLNTIQQQDVQKIQAQGVTLDMVQEWQAFYENEVQRNSCNPTAPYRAALMKKIAMLWSTTSQ